jgi:hypothetical protein
LFDTSWFCSAAWDNGKYIGNIETGICNTESDRVPSIFSRKSTEMIGDTAQITGLKGVAETILFTDNLPRRHCLLFSVP